MNNAVNTISQTLKQQLGDQLEAIYLYGSQAQRFYQVDESDVNLLVVLADGVTVRHFRELFRPLWEEHGETLTRAPLVAQRHDFRRHVALHPAWHYHLLHEAQLVQGNGRLLDNLPPPNPQDVYARLAAEAMQLSAVLAPDLLDPAAAEASLRQLRSLARRTMRQPIKPGVTAAQLLARVQHDLEPAVAQLPQEQPWSSRRASTSPLLPGLQAIYKREDGYMVLVFAQLTPQQILSTDWAKVGQQLTGEYKGLYVTTAVQLRLITERERALDLLFRRYTHTWGEDPLGGLEISPWYSLRTAARFPSEIQINTLPNTYLTEGDEAIHTIIHDFQNKLLNVQLENEILHRLGRAGRFVAPSPLPDREAPTGERIDAIFNHLGWWSDHYVNEMAQYE